MALFDRLVSLLLALALVAFGVLVVVEVVHTAFGLDGHVLLPWESLARYGRSHSFGHNHVRLMSAAVAAVGLLLLVAELRPRTPAALTLATGEETVTAGMTRRSLRQALVTRASEVEGVLSATARLRRSRATITATTFGHDPSEVKDRLTTHLHDWIGQLGLLRPPKLTVRVRTERR